MTSMQASSETTPDGRSATSTPYVRVSGASKSYDHGENPAVVLKEVTLNSAPGEFISIEGPSCCGNRTWLKSTAGHQPRTAGPSMVMDEPFAALDAMTRDDLNVELERLWYATRKTLLFITHGIDEAVYLADRVVVMARNPGRIAEIIDIDIPRPRSLSVRQTPKFGKYTSEIRRLFASLGVVRSE